MQWNNLITKVEGGINKQVVKFENVVGNDRVVKPLQGHCARNSVRFQGRLALKCLNISFGFISKYSVKLTIYNADYEVMAKVTKKFLNGCNT